MPLVQNLADPSQSRYSLRLYFNATPDKIKLHSKEPKVCVLNYIDEAGRVERNPFFAAGKNSPMRVNKSVFAAKVMSPYTIDGLINTVRVSKRGPVAPGITTLDTTIAINKKKFETKNVFYEDNEKVIAASELDKTSNAMGSFKLVSTENMQMSEQSRQQAIMGVDPDEPLGDPEYLEKMPPKEKEKLDSVKSIVD